MKSKQMSYVSKFKYLMLVPIVLVLVSIVIGAIFHLNLDYDFKRVSNFTVKFNTTITEAEYDKFEDSLDAIIEDFDIKNYRLERIGEGAQNGIFVRIPNEDSKLDNKIEDLKVYIDNNLLSSTENIESSVVVSTTETGFSLAKNVVKLIWLSILAVVCIAGFVFFYNWIRYNLISGATLALSIALETAMLLSAMICFRIPFNVYFVLPFIVMIVTTVINTTIMNNYIKSTLSMESYSKTTNSERVEETTAKNLNNILIYNIIILVSVLSVMFFGGPSLIFLGLAIIVGLFISMFVSLFINTSLWSFWYNKDKDNTLKRRIQAEKDKAEKVKSGKKDNDKIVV